MSNNQIQWNLRLEARWETTEYKFPRPPTTLSTGPAVYCWCVDGHPVYVGEAESLKRRIQHYATPGPSQQTNLRMKAHLEAEQGAGRVVALEVLRSIWLNGERVRTDALSQKWLRRLLEAWCIWHFAEQNYALLNL